ncbi:hypothetical protein DFH08DRAFT_1090417 [Mycena albidolilacea]|uniref:Uncharacterized protein n=1 Tax=Mycena albidolilacea TaxID=1033008 RepID=A0AAD6YX23_9AGAR|nr:hypothetical protein DFH08DRAFT_1090417 [Mycena albidolilacea]
MPSLPEASRSLLAADSAVNLTSWVVAGGVLLIGAGGFHYASPPAPHACSLRSHGRRRKNIPQTVENGALSASDVHTRKTFFSLQLKLFTIRQASLRSSLSHYATFCDILKGRTFSPLRCVHDVRELGTHIKILKESQIREIALRRLVT